MSRFSSRFAFILPLIMLGMVGCASTRTHESPSEYVDDSVITAKVKTAIFAEETLK
jgi:hypothetical protein